MMIFLILFACANLMVGDGLKLPSTFTRCKVSRDTDHKPNPCLKDAIQGALQQLTTNGSADLGMNDLDPMKINLFSIESGEGSSVAVKLELMDSDLLGISMAKIDTVRGKLSSPQGFKLIVNATASNLQMIGKYRVNGKVMVLPVQGEGNCNLTFVNSNVSIEFRGEPNPKNGKDFLKIKSSKFSLKPERLYMRFENLFNGDKLLGDNMNLFVNENWEEMYGELRPMIEEAFGQIMEEYSKRVMERIQFKHLFLIDT